MLLSSLPLLLHSWVGFPAYPTKLNRLIILQQRVVRIMNKDALTAQNDPIFAELKLLKVDLMFLLRVESFMFRFENNVLPPILIFTSPLSVRCIHQCNTRSSNAYCIPLSTTVKKKFSISYQGPKVYIILQILKFASFFLSKRFETMRSVNVAVFVAAACALFLWSQRVISRHLQTHTREKRKRKNIIARSTKVHFIGKYANLWLSCSS